MALVSIPWQPTARDLRVFAVLQAVFLTAIAVVVWQAGSWWALVLEVATVSIAGMGLIRPAWIRPLYVGWMIAAYPMGWLVSHVAMAVAYFGVITPVGWLLRQRGYDPLERQFDPASRTYWKPRPKPADVTRYFRQF